MIPQVVRLEHRLGGLDISFNGILVPQFGHCHAATVTLMGWAAWDRRFFFSLDIFRFMIGGRDRDVNPTVILPEWNIALHLLRSGFHCEQAQIQQTTNPKL